MAPIGRPPVGKLRHVRVSDADWAALELATASAGADRSTVIRELIAWYLRTPGAKLPPRPAIENDGSSSSIAS